MLHLVFSRSANRLEVFDEQTHWLVLKCEARNETIGTEEYGEGYYGHFGACPPGEYTLAAPDPNVPPSIAEGAWFIPIEDPNGLWVADGRSDIGIHGGGSASPDPLAPQQGWYPTEGCIRLQNDQLARLAPIVSAGDRLTVSP